MSDSTDIDRVLSPWLYGEEAASPPTADPRHPPESAASETRLLSAGADAPGDAVRLEPATLYGAASRLTSLRTEVEADVNAAIRDSDHAAVGPNFEAAKAVQYVHDRWQEKARHLLDDMADRADRVRRAADRWEQTERDNAKAFE